MKAKTSLKKEAITLRQRGLSYSEIEGLIRVSRSSLSLWLRDIGLTTKQTKRLNNLVLSGQRAGAVARHAQRINKEKQLAHAVKKEIYKLIQDNFFNLGLALYWAEGTKPKPWRISVLAKVSNSDPRIILIMRKWFIEYCNAKDEDFTYRLFIHETVDGIAARDKWSKILSVRSSSIPITIKKHITKYNYANPNYIGLVSISVRRSIWLNRRIQLWIDYVAQHNQKN